MSESNSNETNELSTKGSNRQISQQQQTADTFSEKWQTWQDAFLETTSDPHSEILGWILERNGLNSLHELRRLVADRPRILDAGCGNGRMTRVLADCALNSARIVGIDLVAASVAKKNLRGYPNVEVQEADILGDLSGLGKFDFIYCQEVLHHTGDPRRALLNLASLLDVGGLLAVYVYKRKGPVREFADDYIRMTISGPAQGEAREVIGQITEFARLLSEVDFEIEVPTVDILGISAGRYTPHRLLYHYFFKNFWNDQLSWEENFAINYDWYHPLLASRHELAEVTNWFEEAELRVTRQFEDHYGITVHGVR